MNTAERIYEKVQTLPPATQEAVLTIVELLSNLPGQTRNASVKAGSGKGLIEIGPGFDEPLEDFKPYME